VLLKSCGVKFRGTADISIARFAFFLEMMKILVSYNGMLPPGKPNTHRDILTLKVLQVQCIDTYPIRQVMGKEIASTAAEAGIFGGGVIWVIPFIAICILIPIVYHIPITSEVTVPSLFLRHLILNDGSHRPWDIDPGVIIDFEN